MNTSSAKSLWHPAWFRSNPLQAALGLLFVGMLALFAIVRLSFAQTTSTPVTLTAISSQTAADFNLNPISQAPGAPPLVMLLLSRDEQLSIKAYTDYTDLDGDNVIDTTYKDSFTYGGYFDSLLCYGNATGALFTAVAQGAGSYGHQCSGQWSGNFLNWLTMTRMDIVRQVLFGGKRSVDIAPSSSVGTVQQTILQRAYLPDDVHSFQKVYTASDINLYTPYASNTSTTNPGWSFCNTSNVSSATAYSATGYQPLLRVAKGYYPEWAATESKQCDWHDAPGSNGTSDLPYSTASGSTQLAVFVDVCDNSNYRESFCRAYTAGSVTTYKPAGLLQRYGEAGQLRFGLISGTYDHPRSGGALRRNIGKIASNDTTSTTGCATGDEINFKTGVFCNQVAGAEGIINTVSRFQITQWDNAPPPAASGGSDYLNNCYYGTTNRGASVGLQGSPSTDNSQGNRACADWNNPLAEMYAEALRYIEGNGNTPSNIFVPGGTNSIDTALGLPISVSWQDPYSQSNYCANCSIVVLSTGFGSFDTDEVPTVANLGDADAGAATTRLGNLEDGFATASTNGLVGHILGNDVIGYYGPTTVQMGNADKYNGATANATCSAQNVSDFSMVRGVCPTQPNTEGGYYIAGLAFDAWTHDLRPDLQNNPATGTTNPGIRNVKTYAVSLAETLPSLAIPTSGGTITLSPLCKNPQSGRSPPVTSPTKSNAVGTTCSLDDASAQPLVSTALYPSSSSSSYVAPSSGGSTVTFGLPFTSTSNGVTGSLTYVWEDSPWGSDYDRDIIHMVSYCSGAACRNSGICTDYIFATADGTQLRTGTATPRNACPSGVGADGSGVAANQILVRTDMISASDCCSMDAGFSITGTGATTDGAYITVGHTGPGDGTLSSVLIGAGLPKVGNPSVLGLANAPVVNLFTASGSTNNSLQNPLFYAAKYGGFSYPSGTNATAAPASQSQWDQVDNNTGAPSTLPLSLNPFAPGDGLPDNYFPVRNPAQLSAQLSKVFASILGATASGTAAAVVANSRSGDGATYQAFYDQTITDSSNRTATWLGAVQALFTDQEGNLRESTGAATLNETDFNVNPAVVVHYVAPVAGSSAPSGTLVSRYNCDPTKSTCVPTTTTAPLSSLAPIWNARQQLAGLSNAQVTANRSTYATSAGAGRYIFTFIDSNLDGAVGPSETVPFLLSSFQNTYGLLNVADPTSAQTLINYVRGQDATGLRNRTVDIYSADSTSAPPTYRLGDIVNSTPTVVGAPAEAFDLLYSDPTYLAFRQEYQSRRNVVYVGADDGMLHAFNAGFYNANPSSGTASFQTTPITGTATAHPLGSELWAYVPFNLLPHLIWLTSTSYGHVFYVDGSPRTFDARIFASGPDSSGTDHPGGWGTVLVVGFRFGGGPIDLPAANCTYSNAFRGFSSTGATQSCGSVKVPAQDIYTHSAYVVMDITNPENPPTVIAELGTNPYPPGTDPSNKVSTANFGFTTSLPTSIPFSAVGGSTNDSWYVAFGNGPTDISTASPSVVPQLFVYQFGSNGAGLPTAPTQTLTLPFAPTGAVAFTGDPITVDWDLDFKADALYVGTVGGSPGSPTGNLIKINTQSSTTGAGVASPSTWASQTSILVNPGMPILAAPGVAVDSNGQHWIYSGTGRFFVGGDKSISVTQQSLFGVIDVSTASTSTVSYSGLTDVTNAVVSQTGSAAAVIAGVSGVTNETNLEATVKTALGWKIKLTPSNTTTLSAERVLSPVAINGNTLFATAYQPDNSLCTAGGTSRLFGLNFITGVVNPSVPALGSMVAGGITTFQSSVALGAGLASAPTLHADATTGINGQVSVVTQTSTGAIVSTPAMVAPGSKNSEIDWRETLPNSN